MVELFDRDSLNAERPCLCLEVRVAAGQLAMELTADAEHG